MNAVPNNPVFRNPTPRSGAYWGKLPSREHAVQIYGDEHTFMDSLEGFVGAGLRADEGVVVIATARHLHELEKRLRGSWLDLDRARWEDRYIAVLAPEMLAGIMVDGRVDAKRLATSAGALLERAGKGGRGVRAFGEMVSLLWADGLQEEALHLESAWTKLQCQQEFPLFCAYPRSLFKMDAARSIALICGAHNHVVPGYIA
jgi:hypothetical protein